MKEYVNKIIDNEKKFYSSPEEIVESIKFLLDKQTKLFKSKITKIENGYLDEKKDKVTIVDNEVFINEKKINL